MQIDVAKPHDLAAIVELLDACALPSEDLTAAHLQHFLVHYQHAHLIGVVGLEVFKQVALLRSLAVAAAHRNQGIAARLVQAIEDVAVSKGVETLYLLTTTAKDFFYKRGYQEITRGKVPDAIQQTTEFSTLCPDSAVCMQKCLVAHECLNRTALHIDGDHSAVT